MSDKISVQQRKYFVERIESSINEKISELKQSNEGMSYLKRTRNAINTISEKLQELNNRIKGLTE